MLTKLQFRVWGIVFAVVVVSLLAAVPVLADPGIRLGSPDAPATGYARWSAPLALPATGAQPSTRAWHTVGEIPRLQARPWHTVADLIQVDAGRAAKAEPESLASLIARGWRPR
jgi:hypothetical protein